MPPKRPAATSALDSVVKLAATEAPTADPCSAPAPISAPPAEHLEGPSASVQFAVMPPPEVHQEGLSHVAASTTKAIAIVSGARSSYIANQQQRKNSCNLATIPIGSQIKISLSGIVMCTFLPQPGPPARMYMLVADQDGVAGVTVWGDTVMTITSTAHVVGRAIHIPGCTLSFYGGKRSLNVPRNGNVTFPTTSPHNEWWASKLIESPLCAGKALQLPDNSVASVEAVCASITREEKTQRTHSVMFYFINQALKHLTADGKQKIVTLWSLVDDTGTLTVRDWSGGAYSDQDYVDKVVCLKRVRMSAYASVHGSNAKSAEFLPGNHGTLVTVAHNDNLWTWWHGTVAD